MAAAFGILYLSLFCCKVLPLRWSSIAWTWITWVGWPKTERFPMASGGWNRHLSRLQVVQEKKYIEAFDDLICCVDGRPFGEGLYPPVPVPFSPNQSDLQTYDIFLVFSATDFHLKITRRFSPVEKRWGIEVDFTARPKVGRERWLRVSGRLENRCKLIEVSTKTV